VDTLRQVISARDSEGSIIATVTGYYDQYIHPLDDKFKKYSFKTHKLVICPFHVDTDPSMGIIRDKLDKDIEIFHCFGCGASGDVVRMHRRLAFVTDKRNISIETATEEVAKIYGITIDVEKAEEQLKSLLMKREQEIEQNLGIYNFRSHSANLMKLRMNQDEMSLKDFTENLDKVLNMWKQAISKTN